MSIDPSMRLFASPVARYPHARTADDVNSWVRTWYLAEMTWLAPTHPAAANETFLAVDRNVSFRESHGPTARALGYPTLVPDRSPQISESRVSKIASRLGYDPVRTFEETIEALVALAKADR
jgi:hypothetical protein